MTALQELIYNVELFYVEEIEANDGSIVAFKFHTGTKTEDFIFIAHDVEIQLMCKGLDVEDLLHRPGQNVDVLESLIKSRYETEESSVDIFSADNSWFDKGRSLVAKFLYALVFMACFLFVNNALAQTVLVNGHEQQLTEDLELFLDVQCRKNRIPWKVAEAIMIHETGRLTSNACTSKDNIFGLTYQGEIMTFSSKFECVQYWCELMNRRYRYCLDRIDDEEVIKCLANEGGELGRYNSEDKKWADKVINHMRQL